MSNEAQVGLENVLVIAVLGQEVSRLCRPALELNDKNSIPGLAIHNYRE